MDYVRLGNTGLEVSRICLGAMTFGWSTEEDEARRIVAAANDAGVNFIDTANCYAGGKSEEIVGRAVKDNRDDWVVATKFWAGKGPNKQGGSRKHIMTACEQSLKRLGTDYIDLYIMHRAIKDWPGMPIEETLSALTDLVRQGKVRYIGTSNWAAWRQVEAQWASKHHGLEVFCSDQLRYNILNRLPERQVLRVCERYGIGATVFMPLEAGWLSGKYRLGQPAPEGSRGARGYMIDVESDEGREKLEMIEKLIPLAEDCGASLSQFAIAWLLKRSAVTSVICGPRILSHFEDNVKGAEITIGGDIMTRVDEIAPPEKYCGEYW